MWFYVLLICTILGSLFGFPDFIMNLNTIQSIAAICLLCWGWNFFGKLFKGIYYEFRGD